MNTTDYQVAFRTFLGDSLRRCGCRGDPDLKTVLAGRKLSGRQGLCCSCRACAAISNGFEGTPLIHFDAVTLRVYLTLSQNQTPPKSP